MRTLVFLYTVALLLGLTVAAHAESADMTKPRRDMTGNLVVNASFDQPAQPKGDGHTHGFPAGTSELTGWKVSGGGIDVLGERADRRVNIGAATTLSQPLKLTAGVRYEVSLIVSGVSAGSGQKSGVVRVAGHSFPFSFTPAHYVGEPIWGTFRFEFVGTGPTTLEISSTNGEEHGPHIADIYVAPVGSQHAAGPAQALGTIISVEGDLITLDQVVQVAGTPTKLRTKFHLQKSTHFASGWTPSPAAKVKIIFQMGEDGRKMIIEIGPQT